MDKKSTRILPVILLSIVVGVVSGLVVVLFVKGVEICRNFRIDGVEELITSTQQGTQSVAFWVILPILVFGALVSSLIIWKFAPEILGDRTNFSLRSHVKDEKVRLRTPFIKGISSILSIGTGGSAGCEGPIDHICSGFGLLFSNALKLDKDGRHIAVALGIGAGISALLKAPIGGALLSAYLLYHQKKNTQYILPSFLASFISYGIFGLFDGFTPLISVIWTDWSLIQLPLFLILGVLIAGFGFLYIKSFYITRKLFDRIAGKYHIPSYLKPAIGAAILGIIVVVLCYVSPETCVAALGCLGTGYVFTQFSLFEMLPLMVLVLLPFLKIISTSLTVGSGASGGVFSPGMFIGAFAGGAVGTSLYLLFPELIPAESIPVFITAGMIAMIGGIVHVPIIAMIIALEITWTPSMLLPILLALIPAYLLLRIMIPKYNGTVIIHTNDVHGRLGDYVGYDGLTAYVKDLVSSGYDVLLFDAGDAFEGKIDVDHNKGGSAAELMSKVGYLAMVPGNHEFDFNVENTLALSDAYNIPILSINVLDKSTGKPIFKSSEVFETPNMKIGVFGVTSPKTKTLEATSGVESLVFLNGESLYNAAQNEVNHLKEQGCAFIICLSHLGLDDSSDTNRSLDLASHVTGIDVVLDGHSHTELPEGIWVNSTLIASTGEYLKNIGVVRITDGKPEASLISYNDYTKKDPEITNIIRENKEKANEKFSVFIGNSAYVLNGERNCCRSQETNLGDLFSDALLWSLEKEGYHADCSIINGGSIRESIPSGEIFLMNIHSIHPYNNTLVVMKIRGLKLLEAIEANTEGVPNPEGGFPQVSGIVYMIDTTKMYVPGKINRVKITSINGEPFNENKVYTVAATNYLVYGGDKYSDFLGIKYVDTGIPLDSVLASYIQDGLDGTIGEEYAEPQGRITIIK